MSSFSFDFALLLGDISPERLKRLRRKFMRDLVVGGKCGENEVKPQINEVIEEAKREYPGLIGRNAIFVFETEI
jgi:hypothetical protein